MSAQDLIDFTPVHRYNWCFVLERCFPTPMFPFRCCQIFNVLGAKEEFDMYYRQQRKDQCDLVIEPPSKVLFVITVFQLPPSKAFRLSDELSEALCGLSGRDYWLFRRRRPHNYHGANAGDLLA